MFYVYINVQPILGLPAICQENFCSVTHFPIKILGHFDEFYFRRRSKSIRQTARSKRPTKKAENQILKRKGGKGMTVGQIECKNSYENITSNHQLK